MNYLLDTNVVSELRKSRSGRADHQVLSWAASVESESLFLSVVSIMELETGVLMAERKNPPEGAALRNWLDTRLVPSFGGRVLPVDERVARVCARLHVPRPVPEADAFIAATALVHGLTVVTRNVADFARTGVAWLNPWETV